MYLIPRAYRCPHGHLQTGRGHEQASEYGFEEGAKPYCRACYLAWLSVAFPTADVEGHHADGDRRVMGMVVRHDGVIVGSGGHPQLIDGCTCSEPEPDVSPTPFGNVCNRCHGFVRP